MTTSSSVAATARARLSNGARSRPNGPAAMTAVRNASRCAASTAGATTHWPTSGGRRSPVRPRVRRHRPIPARRSTRSTDRSGRRRDAAAHRRDVEHLAAADGLVRPLSRSTKRSPGSSGSGDRKVQPHRPGRARSESRLSPSTRSRTGVLAGADVGRRTRRGATRRGRASRARASDASNDRRRRATARRARRRRPAAISSWSTPIEVQRDRGCPGRCARPCAPSVCMARTRTVGRRDRHRPVSSVDERAAGRACR